MSDASSTIIPCPRCKKSTRYDTTNSNRPFCSERCKNEDIISWATESYRVEGGPADPDELLQELQKNSDES